MAYGILQRISTYTFLILACRVSSHKELSKIAKLQIHTGTKEITKDLNKELIKAPSVNISE